MSRPRVRSAYRIRLDAHDILLLVAGTVAEAGTVCEKILDQAFGVDWYDDEDEIISRLKRLLACE